ncbi:3'-5' DNA helicase [Aspergillus homomorphus CBS 101889]|uniref:ATP-dependent DNA helicase n=1 Tax=Aspergillus homomorphus (strain CBS 101889) TaxID=1450537 RepID=A0A395HX86_ASPHC|nr:P-loop containing nucleoside triphosphate hydrolase protein [Aspergillus homomorphus CBS 101889]RAL12109.1 P-loop containing nucleoside triphosphate hydrolase protein [Aspergillus homomorphus CBS 101889]
MSDLDGESSDYFDDDIGDFVVDDGSDAAATPTDPDSPRPAKRRRLKADNKTSSRRRKQHDRDDARESSESFSGGDDEEELESPHSSSPYFPEAQEREAQSKYKLFVPKNRNVQENIFVTQLTQPQSPPELIRGPRWKKPDPEVPPRMVVPVAHAVNGGGGEDVPKDEFEDDDALKAAIEASLLSFEEESSKKSHTPMGNQLRPRSFEGSSSEQSGEAMDIPTELLDDIPDDAFDSDLSLSPPPPTHSRPVSGSFTQSVNRPLGVHQTTLFDMAARNPATQPPRGEQAMSPPEKVEPPTQHKLNHGALDTWVYPTNLGKTRDYQFNIAQKGLFHNLLVALPTGLGKTFIAATIMLNWLRWTQEAQIIFVAPTKPLVAQQIDACFQIAGIPRSQTTMLTGEAAPGIRAEEWKTKRVFFMTPQTLINDLKTGIADPKRIVLLVVDEAHRATGGYAYVEVVKFLRRYNQSFRVLALTATPGSTVEAVQAVIDGLDISRVEIRTEQSLDIREYVHAKDIEVQTFQNSEEMVMCMDLLTKTLQPLVDQLRSLNAYWGRDPMGLTAFGLTKARQQWMMSDVGRNAHFGLKGKVNAIFTVLASLAHGIDLLKYHGITPFYRHLAHFQSNTDGQKGGKYQRQVVQDESFKKLMSHLQPWTKNPEFIGHPKLEYLKQVVLNHFMDAGEGAGAAAADQAKPATRVMIFVHFRDSAEEVTRVLKRYEPMIRPHVFVGQSSAKGSEGMNQKAQLGIVQKFKSGTYNTIVATSIGEEGLDIGEVDLIVCYDSSASPIRMLQRMGRTGRKRAGNIVLLLMQGKEEESYIKAKDNYEKMQQMIASGTRFAFHEDQSPRILPSGIRPVADKRAIDIPEENTVRELPEPKRRGRVPKRPPKKFHMPDNVETGFTKASSLAEGGNKRRETKKSKARTPTPEPVSLPALEDVLLTPAQQNELDVHYGKVGQPDAPSICNPRTDAFPRLQLTPRPIKAVQHGSLTRRMIGTLQKMDRVGADCEQQYRRLLALGLDEFQDDSDATSGMNEPESGDQRQQRKASGFVPPVKRKRDGQDTEPDKQPRTRTNQPLAVEATAEDSLFCSQMTEDMGEDFPDVSTLLDRSAEKKQRCRQFVMSDDSDG